MAIKYTSQKVASSGVGTSLPTAKKSIQEGVNIVVVSVDTLRVYGGNYEEAVDLNMGSTSKEMIIEGVGSAVMDGGVLLGTAILNDQFDSRIVLRNLTIKDYTAFVFDMGAAFRGALKAYNCNFYGNIRINGEIATTYTNPNTFNHCVLNDVTLSRNGSNGRCRFELEKNTIRNSTLQFNGGSNPRADTASIEYRYILGNNFDNTTLEFGLYGAELTNFLSNNMYSCQVSFVNTASPQPVGSVQDLITLYESQTGKTAGTLFDTTTFIEPMYNNPTEEDFTLDIDSVLANTLPVAGAFNGSASPKLAVDASGGTAELYDIVTDPYSLGIFSGINQVGVVNNGSEQLERSASGASNWGVFCVTSSLPRAQAIKNFRLFGTLIDRNDGQVSIDPSDFLYNYQVDVFAKTSVFLTEAELKAETATQLVRVKLRDNNDMNYYVDNGGTLVGDGDPTYTTLVNSTDGGSGSLPPIGFVAKSMVYVIILQDN